MTDQTQEYEQFFVPEQSVRIAFVAEPRPIPEISATVRSLSGDLLEIELDSAWPDDSVKIVSEYLLELHSFHKGSAFRCRALLVSELAGHLISMRLVGNPIFEELREFFRIDTYLPLRYIALPHCDEKTALRRWMELTEYQAARVHPPANLIFRGEPDTTASPASEQSMPLEYTTPVAANISGGGLRTKLPEQLQPGCKAILELYLPGNPPRIIEILGEVLSSAYVHSDDGGKTFSTPFKFTHLNENDRDELIRHIQRVQQKQMRQIAGDITSPHLIPEEVALPLKTRILKVASKSLLAILFILATILLFNIYQNRGKSEVQLIFDRGLKMYLDKILPSNH